MQVIAVKKDLCGCSFFGLAPQLYVKKHVLGYGTEMQAGLLFSRWRAGSGHPIAWGSYSFPAFYEILFAHFLGSSLWPHNYDRSISTQRSFRFFATPLAHFSIQLTSIKQHA